MNQMRRVFAYDPGTGRGGAEPLVNHRFFHTYRQMTAEERAEEGEQFADQLHVQKPSTGALLPESLDYEQVENDIFRAEHYHQRERRHFYGYTGLTIAKYTITLLIGAITGCFAYIIGTSVKNGMEAKLEIVDWMMFNFGLAWGFATHAAISITLVMGASCLVQFWSPEAAGGGVTLVMAYLNGIFIPNLLCLRTLVAKVVGTVCGILSSLAVGPEGPMVHIGAAVASVLT
eukprot:CAMPEP_0118958988 /NCGR_PEP_ID=MMETSP1169-20130426/62902_1 /TAXON_ID=36882 /ORGANISM="Pyramimonas obovata, Strain CCMP722" /LENGTH=230 /DNA_ID=CAMNT_0006907115 /DNA_START=418 /DNA_END=1107 /DNA_ORIENTATION=+